MAFLVLVVYLNTNYLVFSVSYRLSGILKERERIDTYILVHNMFVNAKECSVQIMFKVGSC